MPTIAVVAAFLLVFGGCDSSSSGTGGQRLGFENRCATAVEVSADDNPDSQQPTQPWVLVQPESWEEAGTFEASSLAVFIRLPGAELGQVYNNVRTASMIQSVGGPLDVLFLVQDEFCPN